MNEEELLDWALGLNDSERDYLLTVAETEHEATSGQSSAQDSKIIAVIGWAIVGLGTLALSDSITFQTSTQGIASILAIATAGTLLLAGAYALWPRTTSRGIYAEWFVSHPSLTTREIKTFALVGLIQTNDLNNQLLIRRSATLKLMTSALIGEILMIGLTLIAKSA